jgi:hypothetical protein
LDISQDTTSVCPYGKKLAIVSTIVSSARKLIRVIFGDLLQKGNELLSLIKTIYFPHRISPYDQ